jgi:type II restriction enzyme
MAEDDHSGSPLGVAEEQAVYRGPTQNVRALSEGWAAAHLFCPACGAERLRQLPNNSPVGDFVCDACAEEFELKAKAGARVGRFRAALNGATRSSSSDLLEADDKEAKSYVR